MRLDIGKMYQDLYDNNVVYQQSVKIGNTMIVMIRLEDGYEIIGKYFSKKNYDFKDGEKYALSDAIRALQIYLHQKKMWGNIEVLPFHKDKATVNINANINIEKPNSIDANSIAKEIMKGLVDKERKQGINHDS